MKSLRSLLLAGVAIGCLAMPAFAGKDPITGEEEASSSGASAETVALPAVPTEETAPEAAGGSSAPAQADVTLAADDAAPPLPAAVEAVVEEILGAPSTDAPILPTLEAPAEGDAAPAVSDTVLTDAVTDTTEAPTAIVTDAPTTPEEAPAAVTDTTEAPAAETATTDAPVAEETVASSDAAPVTEEATAAAEASPETVTDTSSTAEEQPAPSSTIAAVADDFVETMKGWLRSLGRFGKFTFVASTGENYSGELAAPEAAVATSSDAPVPDAANDLSPSFFS